MRLAGNFVTRRIGDETILVPVRSSAAELDSVFVLNEVGASIWSQLGEGRDTEAIAGRIASEYDIDPATARADVDRFLGALKEAGVVEGEHC